MILNLHVSAAVLQSGYQLQVRKNNPEIADKTITEVSDIRHFFDTKFEYIQRCYPPCPPDLQEHTTCPEYKAARGVLHQTMRYYKSNRGDERFQTPFGQRRQVRFAILTPYLLDKHWRPIPKN